MDLPPPWLSVVGRRESRGQIRDSLARGRHMVAVDCLPPVLTHRLHLHPPTHSATASSAVTPLSLHPMPQPQKLPKSTAPCHWTLCCGDGSPPTWVSRGEGNLGLCLLRLLPVAFVPVCRVGRTVTSPLPDTLRVMQKSELCSQQEQEEEAAHSACGRRLAKTPDLRCPHPTPSIDMGKGNSVF